MKRSFSYIFVVFAVTFAFGVNAQIPSFELPDIPSATNIKNEWEEISGKNISTVDCGEFISPATIAQYFGETGFVRDTGPNSHISTCIYMEEIDFENLDFSQLQNFSAMTPKGVTVSIFRSDKLSVEETYREALNAQDTVISDRSKIQNVSVGKKGSLYIGNFGGAEISNSQTYVDQQGAQETGELLDFVGQGAFNTNLNIPVAMLVFVDSSSSYVVTMSLMGKVLSSSEVLSFGRYVDGELAAYAVDGSPAVSDDIDGSEGDAEEEESELEDEEELEEEEEVEEEIFACENLKVQNLANQILSDSRIILNDSGTYEADGRTDSARQNILDLAEGTCPITESHNTTFSGSKEISPGNNSYEEYPDDTMGRFLVNAELSLQIFERMLGDGEGHIAESQIAGEFQDGSFGSLTVPFSKVNTKYVFGGDHDHVFNRQMSAVSISGVNEIDFGNASPERLCLVAKRIVVLTGATVLGDSRLSECEFKVLDNNGNPQHKIWRDSGKTWDYLTVLRPTKIFVEAKANSCSVDSDCQNGEACTEMSEGKNICIPQTLCEAYDQNQSNPANAINILFVPESYESMEDAQKDIDQILNGNSESKGLYTVSPFSEAREKFNIWTFPHTFVSPDQSRHGGVDLMDAVADQCPQADYYVLLSQSENRSAVQRNGFIRRILGLKDKIMLLYTSPNAVFSGTNNFSHTFLHEFGHQFAGLQDEYEENGKNARTGPNCASSIEEANQKWSFLEDMDFHDYCGFSPEQVRYKVNSIMRNQYETDSYEAVNEHYLRERLNSFGI